MTVELEADELLVPPPQERQWIVDRLAALVSRGGYEHLVLAPLLEPTEAFFPDPWGGGEPSLRRLIRRLLVYADLADATVNVKIYGEDEVGGPLTPAGIGAPAWFVRKQDTTIHVAAREQVLRDPMLLVPAVARVVAEAWRAWHGLTDKDAVMEQRLTDVTSVYLGFGLLTTDASIRHSAERGATFRLNRKKTRLGVLPSQMFAFALALVLVSREIPAKQRKRICSKLQSNQAGFVAAGAEILERDPSFVAALGIPPRDMWPDPPDLAELTAPLPDPESSEDDDNDEPAQEKRLDIDRGVQDMNAGKPVFRVQRSKALRLAKMLALPVAMLGMLTTRMDIGIELEMWKVGLAAAALGLVGLGVGRLLPDSRCSEPKCGETLDATAKTCPRCGGTIAGVIAHPKERLAAEELLAREDPNSDNEDDTAPPPEPAIAEPSTSQVAIRRASPER